VPVGAAPFVFGLKVRGRMADGVSNPMRVDTSLLQGIAAASAATAHSSSLKSTGTTTSFSSALKSASSSEKETTKPVDGANYSEILTGPRAGMYLNTSGGARDGEAFVLVKHDGREDHIYGTGAERKVITVSSDGSSSSEASHDATDSSSSAKAPAGERTKAVPGHAYADILNGPRSGLYLNTSGNKRDGEVFTLVKRDGREFHIYGTGKDRVVIGLKKHDDTPASSTTDTPAKTDTTTSTTDNSGTTSNGSLVTDNPTG
jgi:hypothetical protein